MTESNSERIKEYSFKSLKRNEILQKKETLKVKIVEVCIS